MNKFLRKDLASFTPYHSPIKPYEIKLDANESPFPHHDDFKKVMSDFCADNENITRYPDTDAIKLRNQIGKFYNIDAENVICGVGSDQVIDMIIRAFISPNDKVVMPTPSFSMYKLSTIVNHGRAVEVPLDSEYEYELDKFINTIKKVQPKLVFLCTPNNPTGCILERNDIIKVIENCNCPIVVDEAYAEYTGISVIDLVNKYDHLIVLRTFSKAFGLAGLRTGYAIACKDMIDAIYITKPPYNISTYSQRASMFVLEHYEFYMNQVTNLVEERERLAFELSKLSFVQKVYESGTNFVLVKVNQENIKKFLETKLILIREYPSTSNLASCIRITVGTKDENDKLLDTLKTI